MPGDFSHQTPQRYAFFLTMQRSFKNIISSKINIFFLSCTKFYKFIENVLNFHLLFSFLFVQTNLCKYSKIQNYSLIISVIPLNHGTVS